MSMDYFHCRRLLQGESLSIFCHELNRLIDRAIPASDGATQQQLVIHHFLMGLHFKVCKQLHAAGEINNLDAKS